MFRVKLSVFTGLLLGCLAAAWDCERKSFFPMKFKCVPASGRVFVPCPSLPAGADVSFRLYKSQDSISPNKLQDHILATYDFKESNLSNREELKAGLVVQKGVEMHVNKAAEFAITGITANDSGLYRCEVKVMYPAPVLTHCNAAMVHVSLEGQECKCSIANVSEETFWRSNWIWIVAVSTLALYALLITIVASVKFVRMENNERIQNVYMNTKRVH